MRNKIKRIIDLKSKRKLVCLTAYSKPIAKILDNYCDMILVGDSMATAFYGMDNTKTINLKTIINHSIAVKKGINKKLQFMNCSFISIIYLPILGFEYLFE